MPLADDQVAYLDVQVGDAFVVEEGQTLEQVGDEADHIGLVGYLVIVQHRLQVSAAASVGERKYTWSLSSTACRSPPLPL